jgi:ferrous iron transport protein A
LDIIGQKEVANITIKLSQLPPGSSGIVKAVVSEGPVKRRLFDLGFTTGTVIENLRYSPSGNPIAYLVRGTVIALRKSEADIVVIEVKD